MPDGLQDGTWLLIDAAGPELCTGLVKGDQWIAFHSTSDGFLEALKPTVEAVLNESGLNLTLLQGCLVASGPGSTLGLRLAAMFVKSLLQLPSLKHWLCMSYNNLSLACASRLDRADPESHALLAPWRKDRFHKVEFEPDADAFSLSAVSPEDVLDRSLQCVNLGNKPPRLPGNVALVPYPARRIPQTLSAFPGLLEVSSDPVLYTAEETEFARWSAERHPAR